MNNKFDKATVTTVLGVARKVKIAGGFSLVELLFVLGIVGLLAFLVLPSLQGLQKAGQFTKSVADISDSLNFARAYALSQNTYVYAGLTEVDRAEDSSTSPQVGGVGRVVLALVATKDGTNDTEPVSWNTSYTSGATPGANLVLIRPAKTFDFLHVTSLPGIPMGTGTMLRPTISEADLVRTDASTSTLTPFSIPLGTALGSGKYNFGGSYTTVLTFSPQGSVLLNGVLSQNLEIDLQPVSGNVVPTVPTNANQGDQAAVDINGVTGSITVHRP